MKYIIITSLLLWGCTTTKPIINTEWEAKEEVDSRYEVRVGFSDFPNYLSCIFTSSSLEESRKYLNEHKSTHTDIVIYDLKTGSVIAKEEVDSRYEVRVGFSDYTYSNGTWKDMVFTSPSLKESENFLNEHKSDLTHLVIYDLRSGNVITTSAP